MSVILYSTHCPKCEILATKLKSKDVDYEEVNDTDIMLSKGFMQLPMLEVDGKLMNFVEANNWINNL